MNRIMGYFGVASVVQVASTSIPEEFFLEQNYPNPFNPTTNFELRMANGEWVTLRVYDLLGREVATLMDVKLSPGRYSVRWNAEGFPSGVQPLNSPSDTATLPGLGFHPVVPEVNKKYFPFFLKMAGEHAAGFCSGAAACFYIKRVVANHQRVFS